MTKRGVLVTGGSSGLGAMIIEEMKRRGVKDIINIDIQPPQVLEGHYLKMDVAAATVKDWQGVVQYMEEKGLLVDTFFLNAGISYMPYVFPDIPYEKVRKMLLVNLEANIMASYVFMKYVREKEVQGSFIFTSSMAAFLPMAMSPLYAMTKSALLTFVRALSSMPGYRMMAICPTFVDTPFLAQYDEDTRSLLRQSIPGGKFMPPEVVLQAFMELLDEGSSGDITTVYYRRNGDLMVNRKPVKVGKL